MIVLPFVAADGAAAFLGFAATFLILSLSPDALVSLALALSAADGAAAGFINFLTVPTAFLARPPLRNLVRFVFSPGCSCLSCIAIAFLTIALSCLISALVLLRSRLVKLLTDPPVLNAFILGRVLNPFISNLF